MLQLAPAIQSDAGFVEFPRPILLCRFLDTWDYLKLKVPRRDGDQVSGPSREGVEITIEGQFGRFGGELTLNESQMMQAVSQFRDALHVLSAEGYTLLLFQDEEGASGQFRNCQTTRCEFDLTNPKLFSYSVSIHAANATFYAA
jgi:hypothetical protein